MDVFSRADLRALGWTDAAITRAIRSGRLVRLRHGQFSATGAPDLNQLAVAAIRACTDSAVSHCTALCVYGLPVVGPRPVVPDLTVAPRVIGSMAQAHLHRATLFDDVVRVGKLPVLSVARTIVDVARSSPLSTAVCAADAALNRDLVTAEQIDDVVSRCRNWPGIRRAKRALRLVDARSESPLESVSRLVLRRLRLPDPALQTTVLDEFGLFAARLDFYWDECGVAGEADGRSKYDDRAVLTAEKERQERLEDHGMVFVRWGWADTRRPQLLQNRIEAAFERGRLRDGSGFRRRWSVAGR